eukprot:m.30040 g.30040  ORF g.30040 m.30040 type:complete len:741 (+) comp8166_c0_seq2:386-2608(+)
MVVVRTAQEQIEECVEDCIDKVALIANEHMGKGRWRDEDFEADSQYGVWRDVSQLRGGSTLFDGDGSSAIVLGPNCTNPEFLTALAVISVNEAYVRRLFIAIDAELGIWGIRLYHNGRCVHLVVDALLRGNQDGHLVYGTSPSDPALLWAALVEKAFAKLMGGYHALMNLSLPQALVGLTAGVLMWMPLRDQVHWNDFVKIIGNRVRDGDLVACCSQCDDAKENAWLRSGQTASVLSDNKSREGKLILHVTPHHTVTSNSKLPRVPQTLDVGAKAFQKHWTSVINCRVFDETWSLVSMARTVDPLERLQPPYVLTVAEQTYAFLLAMPLSLEVQPGELGVHVTRVPLFVWDEVRSFPEDPGDHIEGLQVMSGPQGMSLRPIGGRALALEPEYVYLVRPVLSDRIKTSLAFSINMYSSKFCVKLESSLWMQSDYDETVDNQDTTQSEIDEAETPPTTVSEEFDGGWSAIGKEIWGPSFYHNTSTSTDVSEKDPNESEAEDILSDLPMALMTLSSEVAGLMYDIPALEVRSVSLVKLPTDTGWGITLFSPKNSGGVKITKIHPGGPTSRVPNLMVGDALLEVNGTATFKIEERQRLWYQHREVVESLKRGGDNLVLLVVEATSLEKIGEPFARARTPEERCAFCFDGMVKLFSSIPTPQSIPVKKSILKEYESNLKLQLSRGSISKRDYEDYRATAVAKLKIRSDETPERSNSGRSKQQKKEPEVTEKSMIETALDWWQSLK